MPDQERNIRMTGKQRAYLRSLANTLPGKYQFGKGEITENFLQQLREGLEANELIKLTVLENASVTARELCDQLAGLLEAEPVQVIGKKLVLYKESKNKKTIELPR